MSGRKSILIIGVGSIGERHLRCFAATERADLSFCEINPALREKVARQYPVKRVHDSLEEALAAKPEGVVICTPAHTHIRIARAAVASGAHVLIEKPLSTNTEGIAELQREITTQGTVAGVAYVHRAHPALTAMREAIRSGRFGRPVQVVAVFGQHFPFYRPAYREIYYKDRATGGGAVQDALTHVINASEWLAGPTTRLVADIAHLLLPGVTVEDTAHVLTRHGEVMGSFSLNQHQAANEGTITVVCEDGTTQYLAHANRWRWATQPGEAWHDEVGMSLERDTLFTLQAGAFLDALEGVRAPLCSVEEALQTLRVNLAILASAEHRAWQSV